ncbi:outer membrane lipid asymmetry maintenance protein MlaD [Dichelobacter nodosus]|uniref:Mce related family protein n=1 Tax=Dichelobacter nodosus (strain VCS1703A) TaxID=246195 RepID=A5EYC2_DICNV|nr:outer membrane lipid asymmetry maintenance protein MlaD [Dichelobacter nodosus]ABQ13300.1 mce related family protein [Dichelobacter nodosus VCS1703A]AXM45660.1 outer membrane lipid asymmetry maintenance protein MlaD [Dichelobacter nodosus]TGA66896.1 outer membrane lipid asymmetry maintenance protein MlaD [Dichelobacter nodosus]
MKKNHGIASVVGFFVLLAVGGLFFLGLKASRLGGFQAQDTYRIYARFGDVSGLGKQAMVSMSGVQIGQISGMTLDPKTAEVVVSLDIDGRFSLPADSTAQILTAGLLGEKYIGILSGESKDVLKQDDTLIRTGGALVLEKLLQQFGGGKGNFYPESSYLLEAKFNDISGLTIDAPVTLAGVQIGRVKSIHLDQETFMAVVQLEIDRQFNRLPIDSSADILSTSIIGGKYIGISVGGESTMLVDGDSFQYTNSSVVLEKLISQFVTGLGKS